ncbi:MAG: glucokinase [Candidatus Babeliales bacterium]
MIPLHEQKYGHIFCSNADVILAGDIGGTNANFGLFSLGCDCCLHGKQQKKEQKLSPLILSVHIKSRNITDFSRAVREVLAYLTAHHGIKKIHKACFGAAGVASANHDRAKPTNLDFIIDAQAIKHATGLQEVVIINDFEAVAYGIEALDPKDLIALYVGKPRQKENKAIIGAGTGLGKCILGWDDYDSQYVPIPSEGGHADFPIQSQQELDLANFIRTQGGFGCPISWEDILSGAGIMRIYEFLGTLNHYKKTAQSEHIINDGPHPDYIFSHQDVDERCADTFTMFAGFYARCAKDFSLETLALGGIYIAGGIAAKNLGLFKLPEFREQFLACGKQRYLLADIPITIIADYNVSLYGAARYLMIE